MNAEIIAERWTQLRPYAKSWWASLTDEELDGVQGRRETLIRLVQERYGYTRQQAEDEVDGRVEEYYDEKLGR